MWKNRYVFKLKTANVITIITPVVPVLWTHVVTVLLCSALSQEEQDDAQLKIEDILQMVSITTCYYHNILNRGGFNIDFKQLLK